MATTTELITEPAVESSTTEPDLPLDEVFGLLSSERRRRSLQYLRETAGDGQVTLGELAEHIASLENDKPVRALSSSERKRVYISLYQCHLPTLDDADVVDFDGDRKTLALGENASALTRVFPGKLDPDTASVDRGSTGVLDAFADWLGTGS